MFRRRSLTQQVTVFSTGMFETIHRVVPGIWNERVLVVQGVGGSTHAGK